MYPAPPAMPALIAAALIEAMSTVDNTGRLHGQPNNAGQFASQNHADSAVSLTGSASGIDALREQYERSARQLADVQDAHNQLTVKLLRATLQSEFPSGTRAEFYHNWNSDDSAFELYAVYDRDGNEVVVPQGLEIIRSGARALLNDLDTEAYAYLDASENDELSDNGEVMTLDLTERRQGINGPIPKVGERVSYINSPGVVTRIDDDETYMVRLDDGSVTLATERELWLAEE